MKLNLSAKPSIKLPHIPELASTHPHHKHIQPNIKHNRVPAPGLSFDQPNLPFLIQEIEQTFSLN